MQCTRRVKKVQVELARGYTSFLSIIGSTLYLCGVADKVHVEGCASRKMTIRTGWKCHLAVLVQPLQGALVSHHFIHVYM